METGEYLIGINPTKKKTGDGSAVRMIKIKNIIKNEDEHEEDIEENMFFALGSKNQKIYRVAEEDFVKPDYKDEKVQKFKNDTEKKYQSYLGYDFGDIIPQEVVGYKTMIEEFVGSEPSDEDVDSGILVFLGTEPDDMDDPDSALVVKLAWMLKEDDGDGEPMEETFMEKDQFVKCMLIPMEGENKRITIHYINTAGEKTKQAVNDATEITDMKEELYRMNN